MAFVHNDVVIEPVILGFLALAGIVCTALLAFALVHSGWRFDQRRRVEEPDPPSAPVSPFDGPGMERYRAEEILPIMREHFPVEYERYRLRVIGVEERRWVWKSCCAILDARLEIEEICG